MRVYSTEASGDKKRAYCLWNNGATMYLYWECGVNVTNHEMLDWLMWRTLLSSKGRLFQREFQASGE